MLLEPELQQLDRHLRRLNLPVLPRLRPGSYPSLLEAIFREYAGLGLPPVLEALFAWHDGTAMDEGALPLDACIYPYVTFLPEGQIESLFFGEDDAARRLREQKLLPLFSTSSEELLAVSIELMAEEDDSPVYILGNDSGGFERPVAIYDGLASLFRTANACYEKGYYFIDREGLLEENFDAAYELSSLLNPRSPFWKE